MKVTICATVLSAWCREDRGDLPCYSSSQDSSASRRGSHQCRCRTHTGSRCRPIPLHTGGRIFSQIASEQAFTVSTEKEQLKSSKAVIKASHPTLDCAVLVDDAFGVGVARVGQAVPTGPLRLTAPPLVPNIASPTGSTPERALTARQKHTRVREKGERQVDGSAQVLPHSRGCSCRQSSPRILHRWFHTHRCLHTP